MKKIILQLILIHLTLISNAQSVHVNSVAGNWVSLGPANISGANGRIDFIRITPNDSNIIWVGSRTGGLWKSTDAGISWNPITDSEPFIGCYDLAISSSNTDIMYLAKGTVGASGFANDIGVSKSIDGGLTWNATGLSFSSCCDHVYKLEINPDDNDIILAATSDGIYMSIDGGTNWNQIVTGNFNDIKFKPGDPTVVYATEEGLMETRYYISMNSGFSFNHVTSGLPDSTTDVVGYKIGVSPANPDYVYLLAQGQNNSGFKGIYRSIDGGLNFSTQTTTAPVIQIHSGTDFMSITVNPTNANDVYVGGVGPYRSGDGGVTWTGISVPNLSNNFHALQFVTGSSTTIFAGNNGGFYKTNRVDSSWTYLSDGLQVEQMNRLGCSRANSDLILTGQEGNGTFLYNNGAWSQLTHGDGTECIIDPVNPATLYISSAFGKIEKSINSGANFSTIVYNDSTGVNENGNWITPFVMHPNDPNTLLVGKHQVYRSTDGGNSWNPLAGLSDSLPIVALTYAASNPNYIYAVTENKFYVCTDGITFSLRTTNFPGTLTAIAVSSNDPEKVWVTMSGFAGGNNVYASTDAGLTWNDYSIGLPNLPINCIVYQDSSDDALYVGMDVGIYYKSNSFTDWQHFSDGMPNVRVMELEIQYGINKIRAATYGRGLWESDLILATGVDNFDSKDKSLTIFPNPNSGSFILSITDNELFKENLEMRIYNSLGKLVIQKKLYERITNVTNDLPSGIYFINVDCDENQFRYKMIVN
jgi:photosystem II stability/assembly factor-like uncharacterized protein